MRFNRTSTSVMVHRLFSEQAKLVLRWYVSEDAHKKYS